MASWPALRCGAKSFTNRDSWILSVVEVAVRTEGDVVDATSTSDRMVPEPNVDGKAGIAGRW